MNEKVMEGAKTKTSDQLISNQRFTLLELLDRLLDKGVVVKGEILLSVADIDLVYLNVGLLLSSVKTVEQAARRGGNREGTFEEFPARSIERPSASYATGAPQALLRGTTQSEFLDEPHLEVAGIDAAPARLPEATGQRNNSVGEMMARTLPSATDYELDQFAGPRANIDPDNVGKGLAQLVLTLVELIRKLMEKQAVRRLDAGQLEMGEIERMGNAFLLLDERMEQLKETFGLQDEDLNLDLGPLGELL